VRLRELLSEGFGDSPVIATFRRYSLKLGRMETFEKEFESEAAAVEYAKDKNIELYHMISKND